MVTQLPPQICLVSVGVLLPVDDCVPTEGIWLRMVSRSGPDALCVLCEPPGVLGGEAVGNGPGVNVFGVPRVAVVLEVLEDGFWAAMRHRYDATQVIWECKNYHDLKAADFQQVSYYSSKVAGRMLVIAFRGDVQQSYYGHINDLLMSITVSSSYWARRIFAFLFDRA